MTTSTGRLGQQTNLGFDLVSRHYVGEAKNRKSAPKWLLGAWKQINELSDDHEAKYPFLAVKKDLRKYPLMHIITKERHEELLQYERECQDE